MTQTPWNSRGLEAFAADDEPLAYAIPGDTPGHSVDMDALHELFHEQTKYHRATAFGLSQMIRAHITQPALIARTVMGRHRPTGETVDLPEPAGLSQALEDALAGRISTRRDKIGSLINAQTLSTLLHHGARARRSGHPDKAPSLTQHFRTYPSAGALYPCEIYLVISRAQDGLGAGVYRYDAIRHRLDVCCTREDPDYCRVEAGNDSEPPACAIVVSGVFERSVRKYGLRGYRLALIEAGHLLQNLSLVAIGLSQVSHVSASFYEAELETMLGIDGVSEAVLASFLIGNPIAPAG